MSESEPIAISSGDRFARQRLIRWWDQKRMEGSVFLVAGCGALGNEVLKNLALLGAGRLIAADFDRIEEPNLSRSVLFRPGDEGRLKVEAAAGRIRELSPRTEVVPVAGDVTADVGLGIFLDADVVLSCVDNREARLFVNSACSKTGTPWIDGAIEEISGTVRVFAPPEGACYECGFTEEDYRSLNARYSCAGLPSGSVAAGMVPTTPTVSSIIGGLMAQEAVKIVHGLDVRPSSAVMFSGLTNAFYTTVLQARDGCLGHESIGDLRESNLTAGASVKDLLDFAGAGAAESTLLLDRDVVESLSCGPCESSRRIMRLRKKVPDEESACERCGGRMVPEILTRVDSNSPHFHESLESLGIPDRDIVHVLAGGASVHVLLRAGN